jgi:hypothetical protein
MVLEGSNSRILSYSEPFWYYQAKVLKQSCLGARGALPFQPDLTRALLQSQICTIAAAFYQCQNADILFAVKAQQRYTVDYVFRL